MTDPHRPRGGQNACEGRHDHRNAKHFRRLGRKPVANPPAVLLLLCISCVLRNEVAALCRPPPTQPRSFTLCSADIRSRLLLLRLVSRPAGRSQRGGIIRINLLNRRQRRREHVGARAECRNVGRCRRRGALWLERGERKHERTWLGATDDGSFEPPRRVVPGQPHVNMNWYFVCITQHRLRQRLPETKAICLACRCVRAGCPASAGWVDRRSLFRGGYPARQRHFHRARRQRGCRCLRPFRLQAVCFRRRRNRRSQWLGDSGRFVRHAVPHTR